MFVEKYSLKKKKRIPLQSIETEKEIRNDYNFLLFLIHPSCAISKNCRGMFFFSSGRGGIEEKISWTRRTTQFPTEREVSYTNSQYNKAAAGRSKWKVEAEGSVPPWVWGSLLHRFMHTECISGRSDASHARTIDL